MTFQPIYAKIAVLSEDATPDFLCAIFGDVSPDLCLTETLLNLGCDCMVLLYVQWLEITLAELGSTMSPKPRRYDARGLQPGP